MTRYSTQWTALTVWAIAVGGAWAVVVPSVMSASTLLVVAIGGPATVILMRTLRLVHDPAPSFGQQRARMEAADRRGAGATWHLVASVTGRETRSEQRRVT